MPHHFPAIRDRRPDPSQMTTSLPYTHRTTRPSARPRSLFPFSTVAETSGYVPQISKKPRQTYHLTARLTPSSALIPTLSLGLFIVAFLISRDFRAYGAADRLTESNLHAALPSNHSVSSNSHFAPKLPPPPQKPPIQRQPPPASVADLVPKKPSANINKPAHAPPAKPREIVVIPEDKNEDSDEFVNKASDNRAPPSASSKQDSVGWKRSWPVSEAHDTTRLFPLARQLGFTNRTMLNYFHLHKTGGVTTKVELMHLIDHEDNKILLTKRGSRMRYAETCYVTQGGDGEGKGIEHMWRCDFGQIRGFSKAKLSNIDIVMGHQYWEDGAEKIFGSVRNVRHFSIFRHPLPRKVSFFYHFLVRNLQRDEKAVTKEEIIKFLTGEEMPNDPIVRDAGPNYYASRLLSNGILGYGHQHRYEIELTKRDAAIAKVLSRLDNSFVFVGLQLQTEASQCMLEKAFQVFAHVHGIDEMVETSKLSENSARLNSGAYVWTARKIWDAMTVEQRRKYMEAEKVDLAIYEHVVKRFKENVRLFSCEDKVREEEWWQDVFEVER